MAHKFDGKWSYFEASLDNPPDDDGKMELVIPDNGKVDDTKSKHGNRKLSGDAENSKIKLTRTDNQSGEKRTFFGDLVFDKVLFGVRRMIIAGTWEKEDTPLEAAQDEGVWVITKP